MPTGAIQTPKNNNPDKKVKFIPTTVIPTLMPTKTIPTTVILTLIPIPTIPIICVNCGYF